MEELLHGTGIFLLYVLPAAGIMFTARWFLKIPNELFRKILHFILLGAYIPVLFAFRVWWHAVILAVGIVALFFPAFTLLGKIPNFSSFVNERKAGEFRSSLVLALSTMAISITICWGILDDKLLTLACVYAWGVGDGLAALVGKQFGKHKIRLPFADPQKSVEGSLTMFLCSVISVAAVLWVRGGLEPGSCLLIAVAAAAVTTYVELCTKGGYDTVTCPLAAMSVILPLTQIVGG